MKERVIGAIIILIIGIPTLILGGKTFLVACGVLGIIALKEIIDLKKHHHKIPNIIFFLSSILLLLLLYLKQPEETFFIVNSKWMIITFLTLVLPCLFYKDEGYRVKDALYLLGSIYFLNLTLSSIIFLRNYNLWYFIYLILVSISTDVFAFLIGKNIGKHKCSPRISPNKTWEGCIGGVIMGVLISSLYYIKTIGECNFFLLIFISSILSIMGQLGDLVFSKIKRENEIKDFSNLIPGHGGILDRFDSLIFIVLTYMVLFGII